MFDSTLNPLWQRYILAVQEEVKPALGCTEPISLALAAAVAAAELEGPVERVEAWVSPNLMKNGLGVTVPGTGMVGLPIAAALGALGGNANAGLEVLKDATAQAIADAKALLAAGKVSVKIQEPCDEILFSRAKVWNGEKWACVTIVGGHTNIVHIETHNGVVFTQQACVTEGEQESPLTLAISSMIGDVSGMICDGASNSCAMKVSTSASAAWKAVLMALDDTAVTGNEGIVAHDVEQSIANLCALASHSMQQTDRQIIEIMASKAR